LGELLVVLIVFINAEVCGQKAAMKNKSGQPWLLYVNLKEVIESVN
jgi:hypothetical protein